jgi:hypothetical protein
VTIGITTGEQENMHFDKLFSNPSNIQNVQLMFNHNITEPLKIDIWNSNGVLKHSLTKSLGKASENVFEKLNQIDLSSGVYFIKIKSGNRQQILKGIIVY